MLRRPDQSECHPYYTIYINKVAGNDFLTVLENGLVNTPRFLRELPREKWDYRYAPDKWNIKELLLHVIDTERIFSYRALRIARNDKTPIEGFEQDDYIPFCGAEYRDPESIVSEYETVRKSTLALFRNFSEQMFTFRGTASERPFTPLAVGFIIAGHEIHHLDMIRQRYL